MEARVWASRAPNGSSMQITPGSPASARASWTRCRMPPESWPGRRSENRDSPTRAEPLLGPPAPLAPADALDRERQLDVAPGRSPGQQGVLLEDQGAVGVGAGDAPAVGDDLAVQRRDQAGDGPQQRGLPAARVAEDDQDLARRDVEVDVLHDRFPGVAEREVGGADGGR